MSKKIIMNVLGMTCGHCVMNVTKALEAGEGVKKAKVNLKKSTATVSLEDGVEASKLVDLVKKAGYEASLV